MFKAKPILLVLILLCAVGLQAQNTTIIWKSPMLRGGLPIVDSALETPTDYVTPNIGQSQHEATLYFVDNPMAGPCVLGPVEIFFEGTPDRAVAPLPKGIPAGTMLSFGSLLYARVRADTTVPHVRLNIANFDNVNCLVTPYYAGSQYPFAFQNFIPEFVLTGLAQLPILANLAGDNELVPASVGGLRICVYEISLWNGIGAQDITIESGSGGTSSILDGIFTSFPASMGYSLENAGQVHFCTLNGEELNLSLSVGVAQEVTGHVIFRYEP